ncbi:response regulator transcription factor [Pediococcus claussenii]|uniref:Two-component response regulator n=1 Tax=Pediococcus claussenii (strain ATCC BAA-344 / DSM 14800 / JCM 18046 / KCTC 3811 / LMG 21948 / P06) TaxID=701521 RepID=G8PBI7_PEDCP|nr:response regulator transcription factor [Pediococcus claussenii]AEV94736.1 Two-component response regulator [Pediococcus claussenii ATCC BAA-344]ANZ69930.1 DNA-binding response regulator [Pediococcus claussenii]ANZ71748.1 DNA-binding response regulator [Pediococcus claussenii]KRN20915.1 hypothetical protein IV79_GL000140 [Pediococcus claussenii]
MTKTILLVEDEKALADSLREEFQFEDYQVLTTFDGISAVDCFKNNQAQIDLIILDWMLPELDGLGVLRRIRRESDVPIIMLTARDYVGDKVAGLTGGADDYITKPFDIEELLARMDVVLRRSRKFQDSERNDLLVLDNLRVDVKNQQVTRNEKDIQLTQREFHLLTELLKQSGKILSRDELLDAVWGIDFTGQPNVVDVYIRYLRNKIDRIPGENALIHTVRGRGYKISK